MQDLTWYRKGSYRTLGGRKIFTKEEGNGAPLLILHGFPTSTLDFEEIWPMLKSDFQLMAFDFLGMGKSERVQKGPITVGMQVDIAEQYIQSLGKTEVHLLAHDLGNTVAQEMLARQIEGRLSFKILSVVFLNGGLFAETHRPRLSQKLLISPFGGLVSKINMYFMYQKTMKDIFSLKYPPSDSFLKNSWALIQENRGAAMLPKLIRYMKERKNNRDRWVGAIARSTVPIRLICGALDPISGRHMAEHYRSIIPHPEVVLLDELGHYPQVENPMQVFDAFKEFHQKIGSLSI